MDLLKKIQDEGRGELGWFSEFKVVFLTECGDKGTETLCTPITNDKTSESGKTVSVTYGKPRYFALQLLEASTTTTDLEILEWERRSAQA